MAEYIRREDAIKCIEGQCVDGKMWGNDESEGTLIEAYSAIDDLMEIPPADVAPVIHARWDEVDWVEMESGGHELIRTPNAALRCSNCCNCFKKELLWKDNYCPNCGARCDKCHTQRRYERKE